MRRTSLSLALAALVGLALAPSEASALVEVDVGFDPTETCPGEQVSFFFALENVGDEATVVELNITISFGDFEVGPITAELPLAAGEEISHEIPFLVPPPAPPGELTVAVSASDEDGMSEDMATLEILDCNGKSGLGGQRQVVDNLRQEIEQRLKASSSLR